VIITALPLYHIFSLCANGLVFTRLGGLNWLITNPRDMPGFVKELKQSGFTCADWRQHSVQWFAQYTRDLPNWIFSKLHLTLGGGMAVQARRRRTLEEGHRLHPRRGLWPHRDFALRYASIHSDLKEYNGSIGLPVSSTDVAPSGRKTRPAAADRRGRRTDGAWPTGHERLLAT
jgi:long-chain acyl-CoA synthetase